MRGREKPAKADDFSLKFRLKIGFDTFLGYL